MGKRKIITIDEDKCNGCGLCIPNCHEGALQMVDGKARLVSEPACDGLGACIGHCPQGAITVEEREAPEYLPRTHPAARVSALRQWPVQLMLVPVSAPYLARADILIAADCVPFAYAGFHEDLLEGKVLLVACPKLDDREVYRAKLAQIFSQQPVRSVTYAHMEVPCCRGLIGVIEEALKTAGRDIPFRRVVVSIRGDLLDA